MYGTATCPYCTKQKALFGEAFAEVDYTDCQENPDACTAAEIQGIPAWIFTDGSMLQGLQDLSIIGDKVGCETPTVEIPTEEVVIE
jgi:glutaredoxin